MVPHQERPAPKSPTSSTVALSPVSTSASTSPASEPVSPWAHFEKIFADSKVVGPRISAHPDFSQRGRERKREEERGRERKGEEGRGRERKRERGRERGRERNIWVGVRSHPHYRKPCLSKGRRTPRFSCGSSTRPSLDPTCDSVVDGPYEVSVGSPVSLLRDSPSSWAFGAVKVVGFGVRCSG